MSNAWRDPAPTGPTGATGSTGATGAAGPAKIVRKVVTLVNCNQTNTDAATFTGLPAKYRLTKVAVFDASTSFAVSLCTLGIYTAAAAGGTNLVVLATLTSLTGATKVADMTVVTTDYQTAATLYARVGVTFGGAATVSIAIELEDLT